MNEIIKEFTEEDYLVGTEPYEILYKYIDDRFNLERLLNQMSKQASRVGVKNLKTLFNRYCEAQCNQTQIMNVSNFSDQKLDLATGDWEADDMGVSRWTTFGEVIACNHPIMPVQRLVNIDTGIEKLKLAYRKGKRWRDIICDKKTLASSNSIISLADYGIAVNSENAKHLITYLHDIENLNYDLIPEFSSVSRLGWIEGESFSPYVDDLIFDGDLSFKNFFESVREAGEFEQWVEVARTAREHSILVRIALAASFASVLVEPCQCLPFFLHLWGASGTGKTVCLMLAASVWANPEMGKYIHTFNSTNVAQELSAGFVNSLPLILDELQIIKDKKDFDSTIYQLTEGVGRSRGAKTGGLQKVPTWNNCIITTGEQPIANSASGGGAVNRIIELSCEGVDLFENPVETVSTLRKNYGFAGRKFVKFLQELGNMDLARNMQKDIYKKIATGNTTEKQAISASLILTADELVSRLFFKGSTSLAYEDITKHLSTKSEVNVNMRAYDFLHDWIAQNKNKFEKQDNSDQWGEITPLEVYIIRNVFNKACMDNGYNPTSFLSWLRKEGLIQTGKKGFTKTKRINNVPCHCVVLILKMPPLEEDFEEIQETVARIQK